MRITKRMKKAVSGLLALSLMLSYVPTTVAAEDSVCTHHTHDSQCGYVETVDGRSCNHQCRETCTVKACVHDHETEGCDYTPARDLVPCDHVHDETCNCNEAEDTCDHQHGECAYKPAVAESWNCGHTCTGDTGCVKAVCAHEHNADCGFVRAVAGHACKFVCTECDSQPQTEDPAAAVQALVDALPETITAENKASVGEQLNALIRAYQSLEETQQTQVDLTRYEATIAAMYALEGQAGAQVPQTLAAMPNYEIRAYNMDKGTWVLTAGNTGTEFYNKVNDTMGYGFDRSQTYITTSRYGADANKGFFWSTDCKSHTFTDGTYYVYALVVGTDQSRFFQEWIVNVQVRHRVNVALNDPTNCGGVTNTNGGNMVGGHWVKPGDSLILRVLDVPGYKPSVSGDLSVNAVSSGNGYTEYTFNNVGASGTISFSYSEDSAAARVFENDGAVNVTVSVNGKNRNLPTYLPKNTTYTYTATAGSNISEVKANGKTVYSGPAQQSVTFQASPEGQSELEFTFTTVQNGIVLKSNPSIDYRDSMSGGELAKAVFTAAFDTVYPASDQSKLVVDNVNAPSEYSGHYYADVKVAVLYCDVIDSIYGSFEAWPRLQEGAPNFGDTDTERIKIKYETGLNNLWGNTYEVVSVSSNEVTLTLKKLAITAEKVTKTYDGTAAALTADKITCTGNVGNVSYSFVYMDAAGNSSTTAPVNAGTYDVKVTATDSKGSSTVTLEDQITIVPVSLADAAVTLEEDTYTYDATAKTPDITVMLDGDTLKQSEDYDVTYQNNTNAGTAYVVITGKGNYEGQVSQSFQIEEANASDITVIVSEKDVIYDGSPKMPFTLKLGEKALIIDKDYTATHGDNINAGDVEITFSSTSWKGTVTKAFKIQQKELTGLTIVSPDKTYDGSAVAENASVAFEGVVERDQDEVQISADIAYDDANAGENKTVTASNLEITGDKAKNYYIRDTEVIGAGKISPMDITVTPDNKSKIYGEPDLPLTWSSEPKMIEGDDLGISLSCNEDGTAGIYDIIVNADNANPNYNIETKTGTFTITQKALTINLTVEKQFDNTTGVDKEKDTFVYTLEGVVGEDQVGLNAEAVTAAFAQAGTGEDITVTLDGSFTLEGEEDVLKNYSLTQPTDVTGTIYNYYSAFWDFAVSHGDWTNGEVTITAVPGCQLATDINGEWADKLTCTQEATTVSGNKAAFYVRNANGDISLQKEVLYFIDKTNPTGTIALENLEPWQKLVSNITFRLFFNYEQTVTITDEDPLSGVAKVEYLGSDEALDQQDLDTADWMPYEGPIPVSLEKTEKFVYYAKITDKAGNVTYLSTDGAVYDTSAPVIGIEAGTYYTTQNVTIAETNLDTLTLNGENVTAPVPLQGDKDITYTIAAKDMAGNETTVTVTMKSIASLDDAITDLTEKNATSADLDDIQSVLDDVTELMEDTSIPESEKDKLEAILDRAQNLKDAVEEAQTAIDNDVTQKVEDKTDANVELDDKADLEKAQDALEDALKDENKGNYTPAEQTEIQQEIDRLEKAIEAIEQTEAVIDAIEKFPSSVEPDLDEAEEKAIRDAKDAYDKLTDHQKSLIDKDDKDKLEKLFGVLDDYKITKGSGSKWEKGSGKILVFTANGPDRKFKELRIDGKLVGTSNYTHKDGSTIITLKASYLQALATGKHSIQVVYTDGETDGKDYFRIYNSGGNPSTGDNMNLMLMGSIAITSLLCMTMMFVFVPRKKRKYQR